MGKHSTGKNAMRITVVGSINCDFSTYVKNFPLINQTIHANNFSFNVGGKGLNQAVAAARIGADVSFVGCVGDDLFGHKALSYLQENNIDTTHIKVHNDELTGTANIFVSESGDNMIAVTPGANANISIDDIDSANELIRHADVLMVQLEIPLPAVEQALAIATKHNVLKILNPAPAIDSAIDLLPFADIVTPNENELFSLSNVNTPHNNIQISEIESLSRGLLKKGANTIVTTLGARGCFIVSETAATHIPSIPVHSIDPTGAGDVFTGVLAASLANNNSLTEAARFSTAAAALSVTKPTATNAAPYPQEISNFMQNNSLQSGFL